jgi:hypothetical protein
MSNDDKIKAGTEIAKKYGENEEIQRKGRSERIEPSFYRVELEKDGRSAWSGGWAGGRTR